MIAANEAGASIWPKQRRLLLLACLPLALIYAPFLWNEFAVPYGALGAEQARYDVAGGDFVNIWVAAKLTLTGGIDAIYDMDRFNAMQKTLIGHELSFYNWGYPPFLLPFIAGLGFLPYMAAFMAWIGATFALYAGSLAAYRPKGGWLAGLLLLAPASFVNICDGQNGFLSAGLLVLGLRLLPRRAVLAGMCFGLLVFKPHLGLLVPVALVAGKHGKALSSAALTVGVLAAISLILFGTEPWQAYFTVTAPYQRTLLETSGPDLWALKWPTAFIAARNLGASIVAAYGVAAVVAAAAAAAVFYAFHSPAFGVRRDAVMLTATVIASPYMNNYDLTIASAAVMLLFTDRTSGALNRWLIGLMGAVWLLPLFVTTLNAARLPLAPLLLGGFLAAQMWTRTRFRASNTAND